MALRSNATDQMAKRLKQDVQLLAPALTVSLAADANGNPYVQVSNGATSVAIIGLSRRHFQGYNIVAELSPSAGEGFPEHQAVLAVKSDTTPSTMALLTKAAMSAQASELAIVETVAAPVLADLAAAATAIIPNDARLGSVGI